MLTTRVRHVLVLLALALAVALPAALPLHARADLPSRLSDGEFWDLTEALSEENGYFRSDNFLSNETGYQYVIPELVSKIKPGMVYMGVAPEINFTYISALKPKMAFIIDIRRGNLHEHLLYKALFEMSSNRAEFLSRLFSRPKPATLTASSSIDEMFAAYDGVSASEPLFQENLKAVVDWLTKKHEFKLREKTPAAESDAQGIEYVYREAFFRGGPYLNYSFGGGGGFGGGNSPTYEQLMLSQDGTGKNRGFLGSEEAFIWVKDFESKNLLVPVVGDFAGPKAIRGVGKYVREHGGTIGAFYLSNVEQYLQGPLWTSFCANVATLPLDDTSTYVFSGRGGPGFTGGGFGGGRGGMGTSRTRPILSEVTASCRPDGK